MDQLTNRVRSVVAASEAYRRATAKAMGVGPTEANAVTLLFHEGPRTPSALAGLLGMASPSVTALVDRLEVAGMVTRRRHPRDRRSVLVELTAEGAETMTAGIAMFDSDIIEAIGSATPEQVSELDRLLTQITAELTVFASDQDTISAALAGHGVGDESATARVAGRPLNEPSA